jgi:histidine triad (HIT) family protein
MPTENDCLFCRIVAEDIPADIIHVSDHVVAFRDVNPQAPSHVLIVSKEHIESAAVVEEKHGRMLFDLFKTAQHLAKTEGIDESGWRLVTNVGPEAGQSVPHLHVHLLGGRRLGWPPG